MISEHRSTYYYTGGMKDRLDKDPEVVAIRLQPGQRKLSPSASRILQDEAVPVRFIPEHGVQLYRLPMEEIEKRSGVEPQRFLEEVVESLDKEPGVDFATHVYQRHLHEEVIVVPTRLMLAQFRSHIRMEEIEAMNAEHKVHKIGALCNIPNGFLLLAPTGTGTGSALALADTYYRSGRTLFAYPYFINELKNERSKPDRPVIWANKEGEVELGWSTPYIVGPIVYARGDEPPTFTVLPGVNHYYGVEIASEFALLDAKGQGLRTPDNYYASHAHDLHYSKRATTFTLPRESWLRLRLAQRLYYRVMTCSENDQEWPNYQVSTPDQSSLETPFIELTNPSL